MMKLLRTLLVTYALVFVTAGSSTGATTVSFDVTVKQKSNGSVVYQGKTDAGGNFATPELNAGSYAVEFRSKNAAAFKGRDITVAVNTGKGQTSQSTAPGEKFAGGVVMNVEVKRASKVTGQVGSEAGADVATVRKGPLVAGTLKIIDGKRYVWMPPELGSNMGGKWVPEGSPGAPRANVSRGNQDSLRRMQEHSGQGSVPGN